MPKFPSRTFPLLIVVALLGSACVVSTRTQPTEQPKQTPAPSQPEAAPAEAPTAEPEAKTKDKKDKKETPRKNEPKVAEKPAAREKPTPEKVTPPSPAPVAPVAPTEPAPAAKIKAPEKPEPSQLVVPVRVTFASAVAKIDALVEKTAKQDWKRVSKPGDSPDIDVKYTLWRGPIEASFEEHTLRVIVPVKYAATVRAKVKNPLTGKDLWITKGETWGTTQEPQEIKATFHAKLSVSEDFAISAESKLDALDHGKAPSGEVCVKAIAQVCVAKSSLASQVRGHIEDHLKPRIQKALGQANKKIEESLNLKAHAQKLWAAVQQPRSLEKALSAACPKKSSAACKTRAWLVVQPRSLGLKQPYMDGADLRADLAISGDFAIVLDDKPKVTAVPLPKLQAVTGKEGVRIATTLRVPFDVLGPEVTKALQEKALDNKPEKQLELFGPTLTTVNQALRGALEQLAKGQLAIKGELTHAGIQDFRLGEHGVRADVVLSGQLGVTYTPK
jgi:Domain of unknown function (DUF4403)